MALRLRLRTVEEMLVDRLPKGALLISHAVVAVVILSAAVATGSDTATDEALDASAAHALDPPADRALDAYAADVLDPPTALAATSGPTIELTWQSTPDPYAMGYRIYRRTLTGGDYALLVTVSGRSTVSYVDTSPAHLNHYVVTAYYRDIESGRSNQAVGTTQLASP